ncbi:serine/threonine-protein phosphatase 7 long form homolog [Castanea sativa]|uniref:serine/threonine-protein phosphatase 7 long form homolog n=1 Tax=Castanea sativa TaxID=21020 RepID=UPI003F6502C3
MRQAIHRSSLLWGAPPAIEVCTCPKFTTFFCLQEVPGILTFRHQSSGVPKGGLNPRIVAYITDARLDGLLRVPNIDLDHALITALVERWRSEMHSFHLPHDEMTITLQDMEVIMGVPVDGLSVVGFTYMQDWGDLCTELLGHRPLNREVGAGKNTIVMEGLRVKAFWLEERFSNPFPADATKVLVQQEDSQADWRCTAIGAVVGISKVSTHMSCDEASTLGTSPRSTCCQVMSVLFAGWKGAKCTTEHPMHVLCAYCMSLASLRPNQIVWEPYKFVLGSLLAYCTAGQHIWRSIVLLIHFWVVEGHHPECVLRQFAMK